MYTPWLLPPSAPGGTFAEPTLGHRLARRRSGRRVKVGLIGLDAAVAAATRRALYATCWDFGKLALADLGDIRKPTEDFVVPLLRELHTAGIVPVLIGGSPALLPAQYLAFGELNRQVGLLHVDQRVALPGVLDRAVDRDQPPVYHLAHIGAQQHLVDPRTREAFAGKNFELYRLGAARADLTQLEPTIRDADLLAIDVGAIRWTEAPAQAGYHPSGFALQEAGQLAYYAGNSDKLSSFGLYGFEPAADHPERNELTAAAYAQLIWYFCYGLSQRSGDFPVSNRGLVEYVVDTKVADRLTFWRSRQTNRWWVQVPAGEYAGEERHRLIACSYEDYLGASGEGELSDRLVNAFSRY